MEPLVSAEMLFVLKLLMHALNLYFEKQRDVSAAYCIETF